MADSNENPYITPLQNEAEILAEVERISRETGYGSLGSAITNSFYGINHRGLGNAAPLNTDVHGLTFFTKPCLNLSYDNIRFARVMTPLLSLNAETQQRAIRAYLDPRRALRENISSPYVDNNNPFIAILTNNLISCSGWPDIVMDTYTSKPGVMREEWSMADGPVRILRTFDLTANFRNIKGDPISLLFNTWLQYMGRVYSGEFDPYPDLLLENEIDYNTRIYRIVLDPTRQFVQKIAAVGASFPTVAPLGAAFNFTEDHPFIRDVDQISIQFRCMGVDYMDPITIKEFNDVVQTFNENMGDDKRAQRNKKLTLSERLFFNYRGYPRIDPYTNEFEIWVPNDVYNRELGNVNDGSKTATSAAQNVIDKAKAAKDRINKLFG